LDASSFSYILLPKTPKPRRLINNYEKFIFVGERSSTQGETPEVTKYVDRQLESSAIRAS